MNELKKETNGKPSEVHSEWKYLPKPGFSPRPIKVIIAGAGASGICLGHKILEAQKEGRLGEVELVIYDREDDFGGTWHVNRYPGCRCDIPSHAYTFPFAPYPDWPEFFSTAPEINKYIHLVAESCGVVPFIKLKHTITAAKYVPERGIWLITVKDSSPVPFTVECDIYVAATGVLSHANRPNIEGIETFKKSPILHTAEWPKDVDYKTDFKDERVAVIGIGSSGLQTIGAIAPFTKSVEVLARSKFWVAPRLVTDPAGNRDWVLGNFEYTEAEKELFRTDPDAFFAHSSALTAATMNVFDVFYKGSPGQLEIQKIVKAEMVKMLRGDETLMTQLIPDWDVWCRRVTPCASFMEAIHMPHVHLTTDPILAITPDGIKTANGEVKEVDRIILATGFDTTFKPKYEISARGVSLGDVWAKRPKAYLSLAVAGWPNFFMMAGPGTVFANGSLLAGVDSNAEYIVDALVKFQRQDIRSMEVKQDAQNDYNEQQEALHRDLVFSGPCSSWYKGGSADGFPDALFAGSGLQFMELLSSPRWEDWSFEGIYKNRFSFLGNGIGTVEATGGDRAGFLKKSDHVNPLRKPTPADEPGVPAEYKSQALL